MVISNKRRGEEEKTRVVETQRDEAHAKIVYFRRKETHRDELINIS